LTNPNPEHLFEQAERLSARLAAGAPRQVDLRRAISATYYALFHASVTAAADAFVGGNRRSAPEYALAYRSIDHGWLRQLCVDLNKPKLPQTYAGLAPAGGFDTDLRSFCAAVADLQERRHAADYDPRAKVTRADALVAIGSARAALGRFRKADARHRQLFLALLLFRPRVRT
jgi:hypothetical protein